MGNLELRETTSDPARVSYDVYEAGQRCRLGSQLTDQPERVFRGSATATWSGLQKGTIHMQGLECFGVSQVSACAQAAASS